MFSKKKNFFRFFWQSRKPFLFPYSNVYVLFCSWNHVCRIWTCRVFQNSTNTILKSILSYFQMWQTFWHFHWVFSSNFHTTFLCLRFGLCFVNLKGSPILNLFFFWFFDKILDNICASVVNTSSYVLLTLFSLFRRILTFLPTTFDPFVKHCSHSCYISSSCVWH